MRRIFDSLLYFLACQLVEEFPLADRLTNLTVTKYIYNGKLRKASQVLANYDCSSESGNIDLLRNILSAVICLYDRRYLEADLSVVAAGHLSSNARASSSLLMAKAVVALYKAEAVELKITTLLSLPESRNRVSHDADFLTSTAAILSTTKLLHVTTSPVWFEQVEAIIDFVDKLLDGHSTADLRFSRIKQARALFQFAKKDYLSSGAYFLQALDLALLSKHRVTEYNVELMTDLTINYLTVKDFEKAAEMSRAAIKLEQETNNDGLRLARLFSIMASASAELGNWPSAYTSLESAASCYEATPDYHLAERLLLLQRMSRYLKRLGRPAELSGINAKINDLHHKLNRC
jgi:tetratricopeptide (TPR) repeat protein